MRSGGSSPDWAWTSFCISSLGSLVAMAQKKMIRLNPATATMSHQNGMWLVLSGGLTAPPAYWPCQEMMPKPISHTGSHTADFQSNGGRFWSNTIEMPITTYPITSTTPSFQTTSKPDQ